MDSDQAKTLGKGRKRPGNLNKLGGKVNGKKGNETLKEAL